MLKIYNWYISETNDTTYLGGMLSDKSSTQIYEPIVRISSLTAEDYYIIETKENNYKCYFSQENSSLHCDKSSDYFEKALTLGIFFLDNSKQANLVRDELLTIAANIYIELSPEIVKDIRELGRVEQDVEDNLRMLIRATGLYFQGGSAPDDAEESVYKELCTMILK